MFQNKSKKRDLYYDRVIHLYYDEGLGNKKISRIFPINPSTVTTWIRNFALELKTNKKKKNIQTSD